MSNQYQELKKQHYLGLLRECARSGKNKRAWCIDRVFAFMRWQKALREELAGEVLAKQEIVPVQITPPAGAWDTHSGGKHRGLSAAGRTGWLSGRSCKGDGMRCWEISGGLRPSTSSVVIQICERGFNNYYSIVQGIEQPSPLYPAKIQPGPILQQPVPILWQTQRPAESIAVGIGRFCYFVQASG